MNTRGRKNAVIIVGLASAAALVLAGCSSDEVPPPPEATEIIAPVEPPAPTSEDTGAPQLTEEELAELFPGEEIVAPPDTSVQLTGLDIGTITVTEEAGVPAISLPPQPEYTATLQKKILIEGDPAAKAVTSPTDIVTVRYVGVSVSSGGQVFDSNYGTESISFPLDSLIPGWQEGLQGVKEGERVLLVIPGELAYGSTSPTPLIGPNDTLVFVLDVEKVEQAL